MQTLKSLLRDLNLLKRTNGFGLINDITLGGKKIRKNETRNGTFFEIPLDKFNLKQKYPHGDLHLSVFEDSGIITKHVAFKPTKGVNYYYGLNFEHSKIPHFWSQPKSDIPHEIKEVLKNLYDSISPYIKVSRVKSGRLSTPKTLAPWGTASSRENLTAEQKQAAREFYHSHGVIPPNYSNIKPLPNEMIIAGNNVVKKLVF
jgi:hypothetical protein